MSQWCHAFTLCLAVGVCRMWGLHIRFAASGPNSDRLHSLELELMGKVPGLHVTCIFVCICTSYIHLHKHVYIICLFAYIHIYIYIHMWLYVNICMCMLSHSSMAQAAASVTYKASGWAMRMPRSGQHSVCNMGGQGLGLLPRQPRGS